MRHEPETRPASVSVSKGESGSRKSAASISSTDGALPAFVTANNLISSAATFQCGNSVHTRFASRATESLLTASSSANDSDPPVPAEPTTRAMKTTIWRAVAFGTGVRRCSRKGA